MSANCGDDWERYVGDIKSNAEVTPRTVVTTDEQVELDKLYAIVGNEQVYKNYV